MGSTTRLSPLAPPPRPRAPRGWFLPQRLAPRQPTTPSTRHPTSSPSLPSSLVSDTTRSSACTPTSAIVSSPAKMYLPQLSAAAARPPVPMRRARSTVPKVAAGLVRMPDGRLHTSMLTSGCMGSAAAEWAATARQHWLTLPFTPTVRWISFAACRVVDA